MWWSGDRVEQAAGWYRHAAELPGGKADLGMLLPGDVLARVGPAGAGLASAGPGGAGSGGALGGFVAWKGEGVDG